MRRLVIRPGAIGDCILALPAIQHLICEQTEVWLPSVVLPLYRQFVETVFPIASTGLDLLGVADLGRAASLRHKLQTFDSIVSWYGANRPEFREALLETGAPCEFHMALPPPDYSGHATDFFLEQVGAPVGGIPHLDVRPRAKRDTVVIHPFSGSSRKNWPLDRYRELAKRLPYQVEWSAGPEQALPEGTAFTDLLELAEWIAGARLYIGNDSGITHLAAATGIATLALFGPTAPETWGPRGRSVTILRSDPIEQLEVNAVWSVVSRLLDSR